MKSQSRLGGKAGPLLPPKRLSAIPASEDGTLAFDQRNFAKEGARKDPQRDAIILIIILLLSSSYYHHGTLGGGNGCPATGFAFLFRRFPHSFKW